MARRVALGNFPDGNAGLRVSQPSYDVLSNPVDNTQLMFNSDWGACLPIHCAFIDVSLGSTAVTLPYPEDLGYTPFSAYAWYASSWGTGWFPANTGGAGASSTAGGPGSAIATYDATDAAWLEVNAQSDQVTIHQYGEGIQFISVLIFRLPAF